MSDGNLHIENLRRIQQKKKAQEESWQLRRFDLLKFLYVAGGGRQAGVRLAWIANELNMTEAELEAAVSYYYKQGLVSKGQVVGGSGDALISLLSRGVTFVEQAIRERPNTLSQRSVAVAEAGGRMEAKVSSPNRRNVFVVYGRDHAVHGALSEFLRAINLWPVEWGQAVAATGHGSPYIGEIIDAGMEMAQAVIVLLTPDDEARLREQLRTEDDLEFESRLTPQARPNVWFEAGMAMAKDAKRTILVEVGKMRPVSDISGRHTIRMNNSHARRLELAERLRGAGCDVNTSGSAWLDAGKFEITETVGQTDKEETPDEMKEWFKFAQEQSDSNARDRPREFTPDRLREAYGD